MSLRTTCIGAYPKPGYLNLPDWFTTPPDPQGSKPTQAWQDAVSALGEAFDALLERAAKEIIGDQVDAGIDIPTDGEMPRENYIHYHCRHLNGIDFDETAEKVLRSGTYRAWLPRVIGKVSARDSFLVRDWQRAQQFTDRAVKITLPGPMTVTDTLVDCCYGDPPALGADIADALNSEVLALAAAGCKHIQVDEPLFARHADRALDYGIANLERAFRGCPDDVTRTMHMCCGYPDRLDNLDYPKAPPDAYLHLAEAVDASSIMAVSIEDAHRYNALDLLDLFSNTTVILGVIRVADSRVESVDRISERLEAALEHIDADRLVVAPDCGLGFLGRDLAREKLANMVAAAQRM